MKTQVASKMKTINYREEQEKFENIGPPPAQKFISVYNSSPYKAQEET